MAVSLSTEALARASAHRPWRTVGLWTAAVAVGAVLAFMFVGSATTGETGFITDPESIVARNLLEDRLRGPQPINELLIVSSDNVTVDDPAFKERVESLMAKVNSLGSEIVSSAFSYYDFPDDRLVSADRATTIIPIVMTGKLDDAVDNIEPLRDIALEADGVDGFETVLSGAASVGKDFEELAESDLRTGEIFGLSLALVILIIVFRAVGSAPVPILLAIFSIVLATALAAVLGLAYHVSFFIFNMITMIGLALGIDYSLFIVARYKEERAKGMEKHEAIARAGATATRSVLFSGATVVLALIGMLMVPTNIFYSLGLGAILAAVMAVLGALTLLPALLSILGDRIDTWPVPFLGGGSSSSGEGGGFWGAVTRLVMGHPVVSLVLVVAVLLAAAYPLLDMNRGSAGVDTFPDDLKSKKGFLILQNEFTAGLISPTEIVIDGPIASDGVQQAVERLTAALDTDGLFTVIDFEVNPSGDLALLRAAINSSQWSNIALDAARRLREEYIPAAGFPPGVDVYVGGGTAESIDFNDLASRWTPIVFVFVLSLSFLLLMVVFRSLVVPLKAIIMNLLSVGAAYGLLVLVFQKGFATDLLGFQQVDTIEAWLPLFLFSVLFGLSMDYHVILLSRIRERYDETHNNEESVAYGLRTTAGMITGAAVIMVAVFGGFAAGELVMFQQMGFGLAVAVFLDATIVRSVLVPATMRLLGDANWFFPSFLEWLPDLRVEGAPPEAQPVAASDSD